MISDFLRYPDSLAYGKVAKSSLNRLLIYQNVMMMHCITDVLIIRRIVNDFRILLASIVWYHLVVTPEDTSQ